MPLSILEKDKRSARLLFYGCVCLILSCAYFLPRFWSAFVYPFPINHTNAPLPRAYADKEQKGSSSSEINLKNGCFSASFRLGDKFIYPYAGFSFPLATHVSAFNHLSLSIRVPKEMNLNVLFTQNRQSEGQAFQILQHTEYLLHCSPDVTYYSIPLTSFQTPAWWLKAANKSESFPVDWSTINALSVQNDPLLPIGVEQVFSVQTICLENLYPWLLYVGVAFLTLAIVAEYILQKRKVKETHIRYVPIEQGELASVTPWDTVVHYIAHHYQEDISLETVYLKTGIGKHKVSSLIKENTSMNFRQYINEIRIQEAERLLRESSLSVTEVGYEVGFSSATHFNRVFREIKGIAPSEYKKASLS